MNDKSAHTNTGYRYLACTLLAVQINNPFVYESEDKKNINKSTQTQIFTLKFNFDQEFAQHMSFYLSFIVYAYVLNQLTEWLQ